MSVPQGGTNVGGGSHHRESWAIMARKRLATVTTDSGETFRLVRCDALRQTRYRRGLIREAERVLDSSTRTQDAESEIHLFMAIHACAHDIACAQKGDRRRRKRIPRLIDLHRRLIDHLVNANIGLIHEMRRGVGAQRTDEDDLQSAGYWSLYQAVLSFDPWKGYRFSTYACNAILRGYSYVWKKQTSNERILNEYVKRHRKALIDDIHTVQDEPVSSALRDRLHDVLSDRSDVLTPTERLIVQRRFLHSERRGDTLASIGRDIHRSKERVRQMQNLALAKLREAIEDDPDARVWSGED